MVAIDAISKDDMGRSGDFLIGETYIVEKWCENMRKREVRVFAFCKNLVSEKPSIGWAGMVTTTVVDEEICLLTENEPHTKM